MDQAQIVAALDGFDRATPRLRLRRFAPEHRQTAFEHELNPDIMARIRDIRGPDEANKRLDSLLPAWKGEESEWLIIAIEDASSPPQEPTMIGILAVCVRSREWSTAEIGYRLHPDYHRRGFALEATRALVDFLFDEARFHKLLAHCTSDNEASWRLMEKLGMSREGQLRQASRLSGIWFDELCYGMLSTDPRPTRRVPPSSPS